MLEFHAPSEEFRTDMNDPRFSVHWPAFRDDFWPKRHPLGLERMSHITVVVHDVDAAARFYTDVLDAVALDDQASTLTDGDATFVLLGEDTVVELARTRATPRACKLVSSTRSASASPASRSRCAMSTRPPTGCNDKGHPS